MPDIQITAESIKQGKETLDDLEDIKKKTDYLIEILEKLDQSNDEKIFQEAEKIFKNHYFKLKHSKIK